MGRPPRDDVARAQRYRFKLIPSRVEDSLNAQLAGMQASFGNWASLQAQLYAIIDGVLSGYSVPSTQYVRYYAFGLQCNRIMRKFGASPTGTAEILNAENTWIGRGYDVIILDAVRDAVSAFGTMWSVIPTYVCSSPAIDNLSGVLAAGSPAPGENYITLLDTTSRALQYVGLTDAGAARLRACPELSRIYAETDTSDILLTILEGATPVLTEQPIDAGAHVSDIAIDYDPTKWPAPVYGYAWAVAHGLTKLYKWRLDGSIAPTVITLAAIGNNVVVDTAKDVVYVSASGTPKIYVVHRGTNAIAVKTSPYNPGQMELNPITGKLWIETTAGNFVMVMDTTSFAFTSIAVAHGAAQLHLDTIRDRVYHADITAGVIDVIDGVTHTITTIPTSTHMGGFAVDPIACFLMWPDTDTGDVTRIHLTSGLSRTYPLGDNSFNLIIDPISHKTFVSNYIAAPGGAKHIWCINP